MPDDHLEKTISDDELARDDPDLCEHGWSRLYPQPCPECEEAARDAKTTDGLIDCETISEAIEHARFLYGGSNDLEGALVFLRCALCAEEVDPTDGDLAWARGVIDGLMKAAGGTVCADGK